MARLAGRGGRGAARAPARYDDRHAGEGTAGGATIASGAMRSGALSSTPEVRRHALIASALSQNPTGKSQHDFIMLDILLNSRAHMSCIVPVHFNRFA